MSPARTLDESTTDRTTWLPMSAPPKPAITRAKTTVAAGGAASGKRLSLSLPSQPGSGHVFVPHTPSSSASATATTTSGSTLPVFHDSLVSPASSGSFLTALAAQERRVLELKEDLQRAEADLALLKSQWQRNEATRKRDEIRHVEQLQPLVLPTSDVDGIVEETGGTSRISTELVRRKALYTETSPGKRKVFSGSRHIRTLSLLSSNATGNHNQPFRPDGDLSQSDSDSNHPWPLPRSSTIPTTNNQTIGKMEPEASRNHQPISGPPKDALLRTGKQIAVDFREGLWTFIEDLRQATVGDEGISGTESRTMSGSPQRCTLKQSGKSSLRHKESQHLVRGASKDVAVESHSYNVLVDSVLVSASRTDSAGSDTRANATSPNPSSLRHAGQEESDFDDDSWENWESPSSKAHSLSLTGGAWLADPESPSSVHKDGKHQRTSLKAQPPRHPEIIAAPKRDEIPWPLLTTLSPGRLTRTASTLMTEWEKSLTPPL